MTQRLSKESSKRFGIIELVAISTLLVPKAGLNLQGIPFTINLFFVVILIAYSTLRYFSNMGMVSIILLSLMLPWLLLCLNRSNSLIESKTLRFGSIYWFLLVPIFWVSVDSLRKTGRIVSPRLVIYCSFGTTLFGIGQFIWGLDFLKIMGLTLAWGDSYERKNLSIFNASTAIGTKIPSTFQGGNIWGQCSALILIWVVVFQVWKIFDSKFLQLACICSPMIAVFLSFSRTAVVAAVITLGLFFLRGRRRLFGIGAFSIIVLVFVFLTSELSSGRYSIDSFTNSAGRTSQWIAGFDNYFFSDWLFGRSSIFPESSFHMEGILGVFGQVGITGFLLILALWLKTFKGSFLWIGVGILICLILDSTYLTPPLLLIPSILSLTNLQEQTLTNPRFQRKFFGIT